MGCPEGRPAKAVPGGEAGGRDGSEAVYGVGGAWRRTCDAVTKANAAVRTVRSEAAAEDEGVKAESDDRSLPTAVWTASMRELFRSVWSNEGGAVETRTAL